MVTQRLTEKHRVTQRKKIFINGDNIFGMVHQNISNLSNKKIIQTLLFVSV